MPLPFLINSLCATMIQPSPPVDMSGAPSVPCVNCGKHVAISQLHIREDGCSGGPSTNYREGISDFSSSSVY